MSFNYCEINLHCTLCGCFGPPCRTPWLSSPMRVYNRFTLGCDCIEVISCRINLCFRRFSIFCRRPMEHVGDAGQGVLRDWRRVDMLRRRQTTADLPVDEHAVRSNVPDTDARSHRSHGRNVHNALHRHQHLGHAELLPQRYR